VIRSLSTNGGLELVPKYTSKVSASPSGSDAVQERVGVNETFVSPLDGKGFDGCIGGFWSLCVGGFCGLHDDKSTIDTRRKTTITKKYDFFIPLCLLKFDR